MTNRTARKEKYTLPETVHPTEQICVSVPCPNERFYIAALMGALYDLTKPYNWQNDDAHTALDVAAVWKPIIDDVMLATRTPQCGIQIPGIGCFDMYMTDDPFGFEALAGYCASTYTSGIGWQSCCDGTLSRPVLAVYRDFDNETFVTDVSVHGHAFGATLYNVEITLWLGGVQVASNTSSLISSLAFDILWSANVQADRMEIIATWPAAHSCSDSIDLEQVEICYIGDFPLAQANTWEHTFDFTTGAQGWTILEGANNSCGMETSLNTHPGFYYRSMAIYLPAAGVRIFSATAYYTLTAGAHTLNSGDTDGWYEYSPYVAIATQDYRNEPASPFAWHGDRTFTHNIYFQFIAGVDTGGDPGGDCCISRIVLTGPGTDPF